MGIKKKGNNEGKRRMRDKRKDVEGGKSAKPWNRGKKG